MKCKNCKTKLEQGVIGFRKVYPNHYETPGSGSGRIKSDIFANPELLEQ